MTIKINYVGQKGDAEVLELPDDATIAYNLVQGTVEIISKSVVASIDRWGVLSFKGADDVLGLVAGADGIVAVR